MLTVNNSLNKLRVNNNKQKVNFQAKIPNSSNVAMAFEHAEKLMSTNAPQNISLVNDFCNSICKILKYKVNEIFELTYKTEMQLNGSRRPRSCSDIFYCEANVSNGKKLLRSGLNKINDESNKPEILFDTIRDFGDFNSLAKPTKRNSDNNFIVSDLQDKLQELKKTLSAD